MPSPPENIAPNISPPSAENPISDEPRPFERVFSVFVGAFLGGLVGLFFGIGLACFGLTMWLWLVVPLTTATIGGLIGVKFPTRIDS